MRTNIDIDDDLLEAAMRAGPYKTKKDAVEAGLKLLARQVAYRDILALRGKLRWDDASPAGAVVASEARAGYKVDVLAKAAPSKAASTKARKKK